MKSKKKCKFHNVLIVWENGSCHSKLFQDDDIIKGARKVLKNFIVEGKKWITATNKAVFVGIFDWPRGKLIKGKIIKKGTSNLLSFLP